MNRCESCGCASRMSVSGDTKQCESCGHTEGNRYDPPATAGWDRIWDEYGEPRPGGKHRDW